MSDGGKGEEGKGRDIKSNLLIGKRAKKRSKERQRQREKNYEIHHERLGKRERGVG